MLIKIEEINAFLWYVADLDFDPSPVSSLFQTDDEQVCVDIIIVNDLMAGESREVLGISFSVPDVGLSVAIGDVATAIVTINDVPGT